MISLLREDLNSISFFEEGVAFPMCEILWIEEAGIHVQFVDFFIIFFSERDIDGINVFAEAFDLRRLNEGYGTTV